MTTPKARQPKGIPAGGQFTASTHQEPAVQLAEEEHRRQEPVRPLTVEDVEYLQRRHGTIDPGPRYFAHMRKVFEAAAEKAANTDEGRLVLRRRAEAEKLAQHTGIPAQEIHGFYGEVKDLEPMSEGWENLVQTWSQHIWNRPRGEVVHIEGQMRKVHGRPDLAELLAQRDALTARIDAQRLNDAAAAIRRKHPTAAYVETVENYPGEVKLTYWDAEGKWLDEESSSEIPELAHFDLIPGSPEAEKSALRACVENADDLYRPTYALDQMAAVTAEDLLHS